MEPAERHDWNLSISEARALQEQMRGRVETRNRTGRVRRVAGADVGFEDGGRTARAAVVVLSFPRLEVIDSAVARSPVTFPYVPGYLSFREIPALLKAFEALGESADLVLCDGQGIAHPRRFGVACHLGLLLDVPTIGVAKSRLCGEHAEPGPQRGAWTPLTEGRQRLGAVLRTRTAVRPVFVSTGHRVSLPSAIRHVLAATPRYRLPETTRLAHRLASGPA